jgi:hypothetical protein
LQEGGHLSAACGPAPTAPLKLRSQAPARPAAPLQGSTQRQLAGRWQQQQRQQVHQVPAPSGHQVEARQLRQDLRTQAQRLAAAQEAAQVAKGQLGRQEAAHAAALQRAAEQAAQQRARAESELAELQHQAAQQRTRAESELAELQQRADRQRTRADAQLAELQQWAEQHQRDTEAWKAATRQQLLEQQEQQRGRMEQRLAGLQQRADLMSAKATARLAVLRWQQLSAAATAQADAQADRQAVAAAEERAAAAEEQLRAEQGRAAELELQLRAALADAGALRQQLACDQLQMDSDEQDWEEEQGADVPVLGTAEGGSPAQLRVGSRGGAAAAAVSEDGSEGMRGADVRDVAPAHGEPLHFDLPDLDLPWQQDTHPQQLQQQDDEGAVGAAGQPAAHPAEEDDSVGASGV